MMCKQAVVRFEDADGTGMVLVNAHESDVGIAVDYKLHRHRHGIISGGRLTYEQARDVAAALLPDDVVAVDRERIARLVAWAEFGHRLALRGQVHHSMWELQPGTLLDPDDLDVLEESQP